MKTELTIIFLQCITIAVQAYFFYKAIKENKSYKRFYDTVLKSNDVLMEYCLQEVKKKALENEDYETVLKVNKCISDLKERREQNA